MLAAVWIHMHVYHDITVIFVGKFTIYYDCGLDALEPNKDILNFDRRGQNDFNFF